MSAQTADIIIVGAGAAGAELARLASRAGRSVILIEQGAPNGRHIFQRIPLMVGKIIGNPRFVDADVSVPQAPLNGRQTPVLTGRGMGGSSRINGAVAYVGPSERYAQVFGSLGLDFDPILADLRLMREKTWTDALTEKFLESASKQQVSDVDTPGDFVAAAPLHLNTENGMRWNHLDNFRQGADHTKITLLREKVTGLIFEKRRVTGVKTAAQTLSADQVILAAGTVGSTQLLLENGIGSAKMLKDAGIDLTHDLSQVGANVRDHANLRIPFSCAGHDTLNQKTRGPRALWEGVKYLVGSKDSVLRGPGASAGVNVATGPNVFTDAVRIQLVHFTQDRSTVGQKGIQFERAQKASLGIYPLWPRSIGKIKITKDGLEVNPGFLTDPHDIETTQKGLKIALEMLANLGFQADPLIEDEEFIRNGVYSGYHLIGSNRMGKTAADSVVGTDFAVHGLDGLYVCDGSVLPDHLSSHSYLPTIAMARMMGQQQGWTV